MNEHSTENLQVVFVCCQDRQGGPPACGAQGQENLFALRAAMDREGKDEVEIVPSGCLGYCCMEKGVIFDPFQKKIWSGVQVKDTAALARLIGNRKQKEPKSSTAQHPPEYGQDGLKEKESY